MPTNRPASAGPTPRTSERLSYGLEYADTSSDYGTWQASERYPAPVKDAVLVGSRTTAGTHAPAIDLDHGAALVRTEYGYDLWVDAPTKAGAYRNLLSILEDLGLCPSQRLPRSSSNTKRRRSEYQKVRADVVDDTARQDTLKTLGPELATSFDGAVMVATNVAATERTMWGPELKNPWRVPLAAEVMLTPSTHNFHVYLEVELQWEEYDQLLAALTSCNMVQKGYLGASRARHTTYLRLPWIKKPEDGRLYPINCDTDLF